MNLKRLAEISPVVGSFLIFIGYLKLHLYYSHWGINIANYLDFSEITLSFLNDTNTLLFFILILFLQMTIGIVTLAAINHKSTPMIIQDNSEKAQSNEEEFSGIIQTMEHVFEEKPKHILITLTILTGISALAFLWFLNLTSLYITFCLFTQLLIILLDKLIGIKDEKTLLQTSFVIILLGFTYCLAQYDINQTETSSKMTILRTNSNEIISSDKNFIFLGKTNNNYIFFDKLKNQSTIIQAASISQTMVNN